MFKNFVIIFLLNNNILSYSSLFFPILSYSFKTKTKFESQFWCYFANSPVEVPRAQNNMNAD